MSEIDLPTKVICRPWKDNKLDAQWATEPTNLTNGIHGSRTLLPSERFNDIPVRVVNVLSKPVAHEAGMLVANLQPTEVISLHDC